MNCFHCADSILLAQNIFMCFDLRFSSFWINISSSLYKCGSPLHFQITLDFTLAYHSDNSVLFTNVVDCISEIVLLFLDQFQSSHADSLTFVREHAIKQICDSRAKKRFRQHDIVHSNVSQKEGLPIKRSPLRENYNSINTIEQAVFLVESQTQAIPLALVLNP